VLFQALGQVHRVAEGGEIAARGTAHVAHRRHAGVHPDSEAGVRLFAQGKGQGQEVVGDLQGGQDGLPGVVWGRVKLRVEQAHDLAAHELVNDAILGVDGFRADGQIEVEPLHQFLGAQRLREGRQRARFCEEDCDHSSLTAQSQPVKALDVVYHGRGKVAAHRFQRGVAPLDLGQVVHDDGCAFDGLLVDQRG